MVDLRETARQNRLANNKRLSELVKDGEIIHSSFNSQASWFPPRPLIEKDKKTMNRLYGMDEEKPT